MDLELSGKKILITGVGAGIGRGVAKALDALGAQVYGISFTQEHLDSLKADCPNIEVLQCNVADWKALKVVVDNLPAMDGLVNNAGISKVDSLFDVEEDTLDRIFSVNVKAVINLCQAVAAKMADAGIEGSIVNVSSQGSLVGLKDHVAYCSSKGAVDQITRVLAIELGPKKIRTNSVNPTVVLTEMGRKCWSDPVAVKNMLAKIPLGRFAEVEDVINPILFLLSKKSGIINGITMPIDGGFTAC